MASGASVPASATSAARYRAPGLSPKEREADKAVDVTRSVAYFHNATITQPRW